MPYLFDQPSRQMVLVFVSLVADLKDLCLPRGKPFKGARPGLLQRRRVRVSSHQLVELGLYRNCVRARTRKTRSRGHPTAVISPFEELMKTRTPAFLSFR